MFCCQLIKRKKKQSARKTVRNNAQRGSKTFDSLLAVVRTLIACTVPMFHIKDLQVIKMIHFIACHAHEIPHGPGPVNS